MKSMFLVLMLLVFLNACAASSPEGQVRRELGLDLPAAEQVITRESHGGFHGDGATWIELSYTSETEDQAAERMKAGGWRPLPATENLQRVMAGELSDEWSFPEIANGLWYFYDRHSESKDPADDAELFNRFSYNFTFAVFDADRDRLYYLEFDT